MLKVFRENLKSLSWVLWLVIAFLVYHLQKLRRHNLRLRLLRAGED